MGDITPDLVRLFRRITGRKEPVPQFGISGAPLMVAELGSVSKRLEDRLRKMEEMVAESQAQCEMMRHEIADVVRKVNGFAPAVLSKEWEEVSVRAEIANLRKAWTKLRKAVGE